MAKKGLSRSRYKYLLKQIRRLLKMYEIDCNILDDNYWQFRCTYFGKLIFDYYPKNRKIAIFENGRTKWETLDNDYLKHFEKILDVFVFTGQIDVKQ